MQIMDNQFVALQFPLFFLLLTFGRNFANDYGKFVNINYDEIPKYFRGQIWERNEIRDYTIKVSEVGADKPVQKKPYTEADAHALRTANPKNGRFFEIRLIFNRPWKNFKQRFQPKILVDVTHEHNHFSQKKEHKNTFEPFDFDSTKYYALDLDHKVVLAFDSKSALIEELQRRQKPAVISSAEPTTEQIKKLLEMALFEMGEKVREKLAAERKNTMAHVNALVSDLFAPKLTAHEKLLVQLEGERKKLEQKAKQMSGIIADNVGKHIDETFTQKMLVSFRRNSL